MKRKFTESKKANRSSAYSKGPNFRGQSTRRKSKRASLQTSVPKTFGFAIRTQAIKIKEKFRTIVKTIFQAKDIY